MLNQSIFNQHKSFILLLKHISFTKFENVGSESGIKIGKHLGSKTPFVASSVQHSSFSTSFSIVKVISWSRNWPNCITIKVACKKIVLVSINISFHLMSKAFIFTYCVVLGSWGDTRVELDADLPGIWKR